MRIEPLEERRMLAVTAPLGFNAKFVEGISESHPEVFFTWIDNGNESGYEIQRSISGRDDPDVWEGFGGAIAEDDEQLKFKDGFRRYYYRLRSTGHPTQDPEVTENSAWTDPPIFAIGQTLNENESVVVSEDAIVKVSAIGHSQIDVPLIAATIELRWPLEKAYEDADYTISRKQKDDLSFTQVASLTYDGQNPITGWTDENLAGKTAYEYKVERIRVNNAFFNATLTAIGFIYAGVDVPLEDGDSTIESPGTVILVIDETQIDAMQPDDVIAEIDRLKQDLFAEGWDVEVIDDVNPSDTPESVRTKIKAKYDDPNINVTTVLLIGHIPVPMSGFSRPDNHAARAMPADVYYGDMDSTWTFNENTVPTDGDGKPVELMVGRVDMRGLPNFQQYSPGLTEAELETELLRRYLDKDHAFRTGQVAVERKALVRDQMAREDSSTGAWGMMSGFFGPADPADATPEEPDNIDVADFPEPIWPLAVGLRSIDSADLDGDGDADFLTASYDDNRIAWYENDGGDFSAQHIISDDVLGASAVIAADLNGDGCDDVVAASGQTGEILWYDNELDGTCQRTFAQQFLIEDPLRGMSSVFAIDLDGDGGVGPDVDIDVITWTDLGANEASSVGAAGDGEIIPRKYLTRASHSDIVQVTGRGTLLAIAI